MCPSASLSNTEEARGGTHRRVDVEGIGLIELRRRIHNPPEALPQCQSSVLAVLGIGIAVVQRIAEEGTALL